MVRLTVLAVSSVLALSTVPMPQERRSPVLCLLLGRQVGRQEAAAALGTIARVAHAIEIAPIMSM
jgi:hypothetical protein